MKKSPCSEHSRYFHVCVNCRKANNVPEKLSTVTKTVKEIDTFQPCRPDIKCKVCR